MMSFLKRLFLFFLLAFLWSVFVFVSAFYGMWMRPVAEKGNSREFFETAVQTLKEKNVGNAALVLIESGKVFDQYYSDTHESIDSQTLFSSASMSKWLTAVGVMKLVEVGMLDLDAPISNYLTRWKLPPSEFDNDEVTIRRLLSHTAGLTDGLGFGDYEEDEAIPALVDSLNYPRASIGEAVEIKVGLTPGSEWKYSGGGYLMLQLVIEEVTGKSFASFMQDQIFDPIHMDRSTYAFIGDFENHAGSYAADGSKAPLYQYASAAATGFTTTSSDMIQFVMAQIPQAGVQLVLSEDTLVSMREPHGRKLGADIWGLGTMLYAPTQSGDRIFGHDGGNSPAINCATRINPENGDAIILLQTGHPSLATQIGSDWVLWQTGIPDVLAVDAVISSMVVPAMIGWFLIFVLFVGFFVFRRFSRHEEPIS